MWHKVASNKVVALQRREQEGRAGSSPLRLLPFELCERSFLKSKEKGNTHSLSGREGKAERAGAEQPLVRHTAAP